MSQPCATPKCERISRGVCDCCKQNLCLQHLNEHNALLISQLNPLTDEINALSDRIKSFGIDETVRDGRQKLEKWRKDCHEKIDRFFEEKCQELYRIVSHKLDHQQEEILHIRSKMAKLVREQEATRQDIDLLTSAIRRLENEMKKIEETNVQITTHPLVICDGLVQIRETNEHELDLSTLFPVYRTLASPFGSYAALASNEQFLLLHRRPNLCLIDKEMGMAKQALWTHNSIRDICWSSTLDRFIVVEENNIFLFDGRTMSIETIETIEKLKCLSCTCSDESLFLSINAWGSSIVQLRLLPSVTISKEWKSPVTCTNDELISGMTYQSKMCAIVVMNNIEKSVRIELRCCKTMERMWSLPLNIIVNQTIAFRCCSLNCDEWLMIDCQTKRLLHITKDGELKKAIPYNEIPYCAELFTGDMLAVLTEKGMNLHKI